MGHFSVQWSDAACDDDLTAADTSQVDTWKTRISRQTEACRACYEATSSFTRSDPAYQQLLVDVKGILKACLTLKVAEKLALLRYLTNILTAEPFGAPFMNANDAPLQAQLMPFLHQCSDPFGAEARVLDAVTDFLVAIGRACKPIEVEAWLIEQLHEVDWRAKPESPIQRASVVFLVTAIQVYGRAVLEPLTRYEDVAATKSDFIANVCREALLVTEKLLEDRARHVDAQTITHCVLDVIGYYRSVLSGDQVQANCFQVMTLCFLVFDKYGMAAMDISQPYCARFHPEYNVPQGVAAHAPHQRQMDEPSTDHGKSGDKCITRCLDTAANLGCTLDKLMQHDKLPMASSHRAWVSLLAWCIYDRCQLITRDSGSTRRFLLPMMVEPTWLLRAFLHRFLAVLHSSRSSSVVDKVLLSFWYLADNIAATITMDKLVQPLENEATLEKALETLAMVIPQCEQPHLRFVGYRLLARCLELSDDQVRLYALTALLECPFSTMRTAAIGLLKDQVLRQASGDDNGIFVTRLVVDRFLPLIYIIPSEPHAFVEDINHHLQALNFYYFLLQWDKEHNKTCIWDIEQRAWMKQKYLLPLTEIMNKVSSSEMPDGGMALITLQFTLDTIHQLLNAP